MTSSAPKVKPLSRSIYCCGCEDYVFADLTDGRGIYGSKSHDDLRFYWRCPTCRNYVGCHHKTKSPTQPLGTIPTPKLRRLRMRLHARMDPLWRRGEITRRALYTNMARRMGRPEFHTAEINTVEEYLQARQCLKDIEKTKRIGSWKRFKED